MNKRTGLKAAVASAALIFAAATPALAITVDAAGGRWSYDSGANSTWSNYYHSSQEHSSSVKSGSHIFDSGCTAKGKWSLASIGDNDASVYYNPNRKC
ncbi:lactococcin 972 family bacteriocin [Streptomyces sp. NBC_01563]|uniref:lactococcin 972 family bacteriocin n=1 Tax=Streptomyces sp. NBC_01563 TaxID=2975880 RepID=UPI003866B0B6